MKRTLTLERKIGGYRRKHKTLTLVITAKHEKTLAKAEGYIRRVWASWSKGSGLADHEKTYALNLLNLGLKTYYGEMKGLKASVSLPTPRRAR